MSHAVVVTGPGGPEVLRWQEVEVPEPGPGQIRLAVRAAGVGPTDLAIRRGVLQAVFPLPDPGILGFEAAGVVDAVGPGVEGVAPGSEVAALLPGLGGYAEHVLASVWAEKPAEVSWSAAAALPASAEAAVGVVRQSGVHPGGTLLVLGAGGSVGLIAVQLALAGGIRVVAAARAHDHELLAELGALPVDVDADLARGVRASVDGIDGVVDAAGAGVPTLQAAVDLVGDPSRVVTLVTPRGHDLGIRMSEPGPDRAPDALAVTLPLLAAGRLRLRERTEFALTQAAAAHEALEARTVRAKVVLLAP